MNPRTLMRVLMLALVGTYASQAHAAAYIKFDGVDGESKATDRQHPPMRVIKASPLLPGTLSRNQVGTTSRELDKSSPKLIGSTATVTVTKRPSAGTTHRGSGSGSGKAHFGDLSVTQ